MSSIIDEGRNCILEAHREQPLYYTAARQPVPIAGFGGYGQGNAGETAAAIAHKPL
jgi:hypothetical protein